MQINKYLKFIDIYNLEGVLCLYLLNFPKETENKMGNLTFF